MRGWGCIFLERGSRSKCLLVSLSVLSDPRLMGYGGDLCVALPAQTVSVFSAVICWKLGDRHLGKWIILQLKIWQKKEEPLVISLCKQVMWPSTEHSYCLLNLSVKSAFAVQLCCSASGLYYPESSQKTLCPQKMKCVHFHFLHF